MNQLSLTQDHCNQGKVKMEIYSLKFKVPLRLTPRLALILFIALDSQTIARSYMYALIL